MKTPCFCPSQEQDTAQNMNIRDITSQEDLIKTKPSKHIQGLGAQHSVQHLPASPTKIKMKLSVFFFAFAFVWHSVHG
jgi:hypothetical protein